MLIFNVIKRFGLNTVTLLSIKAHNISCNNVEVANFEEEYSIIENEFKKICDIIENKKKINEKISLKDLPFSIKVFVISRKYWHSIWINKWIDCELSRRKNYNYPCNLNINQFYNIWNQVGDEFLVFAKKNRR